MLMTCHFEASVLISGTFWCALKTNINLLRGGVYGTRWPGAGMGDNQFWRWYEVQEWYEGWWKDLEMGCGSDMRQGSWVLVVYMVN